jgi:guanylate kinase
MTAKQRGRLVVLTGPSCAGKTPLVRAFRRFRPEQSKALRSVVLLNSRSPRPGEVDGVEHHFRSRDHIERLREDERYVLVDVRGDLQALDVVELAEWLSAGDAIYEGNPYVARELLTDPRLASTHRLSVFLSPLSREEILYLREQPTVSLRSLTTELMRRKQLRRTRRLKGILSAHDLDDVERRAKRAYDELRAAHEFDFVVPNHDGEDSENWDAFHFPLGDARKALLAVVDLLAGEIPVWAEKWEPDLLPP